MFDPTCTNVNWPWLGHTVVTGQPFGSTPLKKIKKIERNKEIKTREQSASTSVCNNIVNHVHVLTWYLNKSEKKFSADIVTKLDSM